MFHNSIPSPLLISVHHFGTTNKILNILGKIFQFLFKNEHSDAHSLPSIMRFDYNTYF